MSTVSKAIDAYGGRFKLAKDLGLSWPIVNRWYRSGVVPVEHCQKASKVLGVPARELNAPVAKVFA